MISILGIWVVSFDKNFSSSILKRISVKLLFSFLKHPCIARYLVEHHDVQQGCNVFWVLLSSDIEFKQSLLITNKSIIRLNRKVDWQLKQLQSSKITQINNFKAREQKQEQTIALQREEEK